MPGKKGEVRAMISDFGLCKKLKVSQFILNCLRITSIRKDLFPD
jgi:hypothetical protein